MLISIQKALLQSPAEEEIQRVKEISINPFSGFYLFLSYLSSFPQKEGLAVLKVGAGLPENLVLFVRNLAKIEVIENNPENKAINYFSKLLPLSHLKIIREDVTRYNLGDNRYGGTYCADLISLLPREQGEEIVRGILKSLDVGGVFYFDFCGPRTWDYRTQKANFESLGERSYRLRSPEPCEYGGCHEYLTLYTEEEIRQLLDGYEILAFFSQEAPSDFSDGRPMESMTVIGRKIKQ
jgi:hypothetical protein